MTGIILAGGRALRMGGLDKAFLKIGGTTIIKGQVKTLKKIFRDVIIVANSADKYKRLEGVKVVSDVIPGQGPLGGIYSGLLASRSFYNFVVACDMPFLNEALIRYMLRNRHDYDMLLPKTGREHHPLFGVYSKNCVPAIAASIERRKLHVLDIFPKVKGRFLPLREIERFDGRLLSLANINTNEDYEACLTAK